MLRRDRRCRPSRSTGLRPLAANRLKRSDSHATCPPPGEFAGAEAVDAPNEDGTFSLSFGGRGEFAGAEAALPVADLTRAAFECRDEDDLLRRLDALARR